MEFLELSWVLTVAPLAIVLIFCTWLRAPDWLAERADWRARLRAALVLAVPLATILGGVAVYRVYEVPATPVDLLWRTPEVTRVGDVEARRTADLYRRACDLMSKPRFLALGSDQRFDAGEAASGNLLQAEPRAAWLRENAQSLTLALEAADRPECDFAHTLDPGTIYLSPLPRLGLLIALSAQDLELKGELDAALDRYQAALRMANQLRRQPGLAGEAIANTIEQIVFNHLPYWGARVSQTPERIHAAIADISKLTPFRPMAGIVEYEYRGLAHRLFTTDGSLLSTDAHAGRSAILARWLPWERTRSWRVLAYLAALDLDDVAAAELALAGQQTPAGYWGIDPAGRGEAIRLAQTSLFLASDALDYQQPSMGIALIDSRREAVAYRRAVRLALAAEAWRLEHEELPGTLKQLELGGGDQASLDPYTNQPFEYFPAGFRADVQSENVIRVGARTPVLLSPGRAYAGYLRERLEHVRLTSADEIQPASASPHASGESLPGLLFPIPGEME